MSEKQPSDEASARPADAGAGLGRRDTWEPGSPYITQADFEHLTGGERRAAIDMAMGAASMCWDPIPSGVFESDRAAQIGADLAAYLDVEPNMSAEEGSWLLTLLYNSIPRNPMDRSANWEGSGRAYAERILTRVANGGPSALERRHAALVEELKQMKIDRENEVSIDTVLEKLGADL